MQFEREFHQDSNMLQKYLHNDPPIHIRRTLDQYYFMTLESTKTRDSDQVVHRETRGNRLKSHHSDNHGTRLVMVDQLWLWILDDSKATSLHFLDYIMETDDELCRYNYNVVSKAVGQKQGRLVRCSQDAS